MKASTVFVCLVVSLVMLLSFSPSSKQSTLNEDDFEISTSSRNHLIAYSTHDPIEITSDAYFTLNATAEGWDGDGSPGDPYIIEGYNITSNGNCIEIFESTVHYVIRNCYLTSETGILGHGFYSYDSPNGTIESCIITRKDNGLRLDYSHDFVLKNNTIFETDGHGIYFGFS